MIAALCVQKGYWLALFTAKALGSWRKAVHRDAIGTTSVPWELLIGRRDCCPVVEIKTRPSEWTCWLLSGSCDSFCPMNGWQKWKKEIASLKWGQKEGELALSGWRGDGRGSFEPASLVYLEQLSKCSQWNGKSKTRGHRLKLRGKRFKASIYRPSMWKNMPLWAPLYLSFFILSLWFLVFRFLYCGWKDGGYSIYPCPSWFMNLEKIMSQPPLE